MMVGDGGESSTSAQASTLVPKTVYSLVHYLHTTINQSIDTSLNWEQLNSPPINYTLVKPLISSLFPGSYDEGPATVRSDESYRASRLLSVSRTNSGYGEDGQPAPTTSQDQGEHTGTGAVLYALMINRLQFMTLAEGDLSTAPLQLARASFCETVAIKVLRRTSHLENEVEFVGELVRSFSPFEGAPPEVWASLGDDSKELRDTRGSALELAIITTSKRFLSQTVIQHLVNQIYEGILVYSPTRTSHLIADSYISDRSKARRRSPSRRASCDTPDTAASDALPEVYVYNPFEAGWLDHQRLKVPKWRKWLEFLEFAILLLLFILTLAFKRLDSPNWIEVIAAIFTFGFMLDEFAASKEHGWTVYVANAWNAFDMSYIAIFHFYFTLRVIGLASNSPPTSDLAFDILSIGACILFPRLVFFLIKDNVVILALKAMISRFIGFMSLVIVAFSGICFCLWTLGRGTWTVRQITWLMLQIWFGSSYLGFSSSESFHPIFGPIILISYAALCNTLLITILISILSNKFAEINANAQEEHLFQHVVNTVEGVKADFVFSYLPPLNLLAFVVFNPLSLICSPRTLHRINVFTIRLTSFPILVGISAYERWSYRSKRRIYIGQDEGSPRSSFFHSLLSVGSEPLLLSVFDYTPPLVQSASLGPPETPKRDKQEYQAETQDQDVPVGGFASPLAKLFGRATTAKVSQADRDEVEVLKGEMRDIRSSQLKMEEMLTKVLGSHPGGS